MHYAEIIPWTAFAAFAALALTWPRCGLSFWALPADRLFVVARVRTADGFHTAVP